MNRTNDSRAHFDCIILGAGIAGLLAAQELSAAGLKVVVLEKGRGYGGRMATRRMGGATLDHGAQFFTVRQEPFAQKVEALLSEASAVLWHKSEQGFPRYRGSEGMSSIGKYWGEHLDVRREHRVHNVKWIGDYWEVRCENEAQFRGQRILSTIPTPQALELIEESALQLDSEDLQGLQQIRYEPTLALLAILKGPTSLKKPGMLKFKAHPVIETISDNQVKGISKVPALTIHSSHAFAREKFDAINECTTSLLIRAAQEHVSFEVEEWKLHRWRYANCSQSYGQNFFQSQHYPLWMAGDGFGTPRIEGAALSGMLAAQSILNK